MKLMYLRTGIIGLVFACWMGQSFAAEPSQKWQEASDFYKAGQFADAAMIFESLSGEIAPEQKAVLYYNLGNCYFRGKQWSQAILNFERAIALNPWYSDARYNLKTVKTKLEYKIEDKRGLFIRFNSLALQWVKTSDFLLLGLLVLAGMLLSGVFWVRNKKGASFFSFPRLELAVLVVLFLTLWGSKLFYERNYQEAIVLAEEAEVRYGPSLGNQSLMKLGGGLKVFIVDERESWSRIVTWNGETGWIKNSELGKVRL